MKVIITESQYKILQEQTGLEAKMTWAKKPPKTYDKNITKGLVSILQKSRNYHEVHNHHLESFSNALIEWAKKNPSFNPVLLKASIGILFAESKLDVRELRTAKEVGGAVLNAVTLNHFDASQGYAQIKPSTAKEYGINPEDLKNMEGSLDAIYKILLQNYGKAKQSYKGSFISIFKDGVVKQVPATNNDAALHAAIVGHNAGIYKLLGDWCETNMKDIANKCNEKSRVVYTGKPEAVTNPNKKIPNYIPAIKHSRAYGMNVKKYFDTLSGLPEELKKVSSKNIT